VISDRAGGLAEDKLNMQRSIYPIEASVDSSREKKEHVVKIRRLSQLVDDSVVAQPTFFVGKVFVSNVKSHPSSSWKI
jgi:hypothetical protein